MSTGYGRGGRGAALLQALTTPARKPGQPPSPPRGPGGDGPPQAAAAASQPAVAPMGRGAMLRHVVAAKEASQAPSIPVGRGMALGIALGRGAALQPPGASSSIGQAHPPVRPMGRGLGLVAQSISDRPAPVQAVPAVRAVAPAIIRPAAKPTVASPPVVSRPPAASPPPVVSPPPAVSKPPGSLQSEKPKPGGPALSSSKQQEEGRVSMLENMMQNMELEKPAVECRGKGGDKVPLAANYIRITASNQEGVYQYAVSYNPEVDSMAIRRRLLYELSDITGTTRCFDGAILFLPKKLPQQESVGRVSTREGTEVTVTIKLVKVVPHRSCTQLYNVLFNNIMTILKMCPVGRQYYDPHRPTAVPQHKLEIWPGYVTSVKEYDGGLMLLTDVSHKVLRTETVLDLIQDVYSANPRGFHDMVEKKVIGTTVLTRYNNKTYRVDEIDWEKSPSDVFETKAGPVSFVDYYKSAYGKTITDLRQPMLVHKPTKKEQRLSRGRTDLILLVPELCNATGLTDEMRTDFRVMKDLAVHTRVTPEQRQAALRKFCENVNSQAEARLELEKWGLRLENDTVKVEGRTLPHEKIYFSNTEVDSGRKADWSLAAVTNRVITPVDLRNWMILFVQRDEPRVVAFLRTLEQVLPSLGIRYTKPQLLPLQNDRTETFTKTIRQNLNPQVQIVVTIFPTKRDDRYNALKKLCYHETPVASQVIQSRTIGDQRKLKSVVQKIALQMNCKLGGELWAVKIPVEGLMVCGIDAYHNVLHRKKSIGGFVASLNNTCTRWFSKVCHQMEGQELVDGLKMCLTAAIRQYHKENHKPPDRIIIYRDGVGDGDLQYVTSHEVSQLQSCFASFGESYQPRMAMIVVQKRINTRIFLRQGSGPRSRLDNPPPGTVLDHTATRRELYDFFLVSQHVNQGTVTPTHYVVVHDNSGWSIDVLQKLTYKLGHLYYNWPGTIRVPAPCQYAHRLAYMVGQNLGGAEPSPELTDRLFFL